MTKYTCLIISGVLLILASIWIGSYVGFHCAAWAKFPCAVTLLVGLASGLVLVFAGVVNLIRIHIWG